MTPEEIARGSLDPYDYPHKRKIPGACSCEECSELLAGSIRAYGDDRAREAFEAGYKIACRNCLPHDPPTGDILAARGAYEDWRRDEDD
jgi:hypothetical protein